VHLLAHTRWLPTRSRVSGQAEEGGLSHPASPIRDHDPGKGIGDEAYDNDRSRLRQRTAENYALPLADYSHNYMASFGSTGSLANASRKLQVVNKPIRFTGELSVATFQILQRDQPKCSIFGVEVQRHVVR
jgi:hypothetical protein